MSEHECGAMLELVYDTHRAQLVCRAKVGHDGPHGGPFSGGRLAGQQVDAYILWPYVPKPTPGEKP